MENKIIRERLTALRKVMADREIDFYMMPTADFHNSEYVNDYFKVRQYFCNFSGSNGTLLVWREGAGLWTDGRYFIQAEKELEGTGVTLFRMLDDGVPTIEEFLQQNMKEGETLGFDGRVISAREGKKYEESLAEKKKNIRFAFDQDLSDEIWTDRPPFPCGRVFVLPDEIAGKSVKEKLSEVRKKLKEEKAESLLLTKLDDIMWLFNIRGCDVECNPVAMSYAYIDEERAVLFLQKEAVSGDGRIKGADRLKVQLDYDCKAHFEKNKIEVKEYGEVTAFLRGLPEMTNVLLDVRHVSYKLYKILSERANVTEANNPTELLKSRKSIEEQKKMEEVFLKDNVALTKFIFWLKKNIGMEEITEVSAADKLEEFRREIPEFIDLSFPTIAGYEANAAMMHYEATKEDHAVLKPEGLFLVDSGGQYLGGTTDVTRTIALGPVRDIEKYHYTLVAMGQLALTNARWIYGCTGRNLDLLARKPLWEIGLDYKCGTGHGVGYILNVHEGPQNMRWRFTAGMAEVPFEDGMDITNEPGVYIEGSHGIRIENVMIARNDEKNEYGQFMHFDTLTWVPFDMEAIDLSIMPAESIKQLAAYQKTVYEKLAPYLDEEEREWLKKETTVEGC